MHPAILHEIWVKLKGPHMSIVARLGHACVRAARVRACVRACVRAFVRAWMRGWMNQGVTQQLEKGLYPVL
jgi:hypothetical protein